MVLGKEADHIGQGTGHNCQDVTSHLFGSEGSCPATPLYYGTEDGPTDDPRHGFQLLLEYGGIRWDLFQPGHEHPLEFLLQGGLEQWLKLPVSRLQVMMNYGQKVEDDQDEVARAHQRLEQGGVRGKIVLQVASML